MRKVFFILIMFMTLTSINVLADCKVDGIDVVELASEHPYPQLLKYDDLDASFTNIAKNKVLPKYQNYVLNAIKYHIESSAGDYRVAKNILKKYNSNEDGNVVFFFDGCSVNLDGATYGFSGYYKNGNRYNTSAVCIVVRANSNGRAEIVYATADASTMADNVRKSSLNGGTDVSITKDGIYNIQTFNHLGKYAALNISLPTNSSLRCPYSGKSYSSTGSGINIHSRSFSSDIITENTYSSTGCFVVGKYKTYNDYADYNSFIKAVTGVSNARSVLYPSNGMSEYHLVGITIIDRSNYVTQLATIFGDDNASNGYTGKEIASMITEKSTVWNKAIDSNIDIPSLPSTPAGHNCSNCVSVTKGGSVTNVSTVLNVRSGPGTSYEKLFELLNGASLVISVECNGWYLVTDAGGSSGWVSAEYVEVNDTHTHNFVDYGSYEGTHPHRRYKRCSCGETQLISGKNYYDEAYTLGHEAAHPHRQYKICNVCGYDFTEYTGKTRLVDGCTSCYPYIPVAPVISCEKTVWTEIEDVTITWEACANADYYFPMAYCNGERVAVCWGTPELTYSVQLPPGIYIFQVASVNAASGETVYGDAFQIEVVDTTIPEIPVITISKNQWSESETITMSWQECVNADLYFPMAYDSNGERVAVCWGTPELSYGFNLPAGRYILQVGSVNSSTGEVTYGATTTVTVTEKNYTVKYNANGGSGAPSSQSKRHGVSLTLSSTKPTKTGYTFSGWATSANGSVAYKSGASYTSNKNVTLYAVWKANTYKVAYNSNGGTGTMSTVTHTYDTAKKLTANAFTKTGYTFQGWATSATATSATYTDMQSVNNLTSTSGKTITLYAVWKANTYKVAYNANGGTGTMSTVTHTYDASKALTANAFTRTGYTFQGWAISATATSATYTNKQSVKNLTSTSGKTITLYAVWKINVLTIQYSANGGTVKSDSYYIDSTSTVINSSSTAKPAANAWSYGEGSAKNGLTNPSTFKLSRSGYTFVGWCLNKDGSEELLDPNDTTLTSNYIYPDVAKGNKTVILYAIWQPLPYTKSTATKYNGYALCNVELNNIPENCVLVVSGYQGGRMIFSEPRITSKTEETFAVIGDVDTVKVFVFDNASKITPITENEIIPV